MPGIFLLPLFGGDKRGGVVVKDIIFPNSINHNLPSYYDQAIKNRQFTQARTVNSLPSLRNQLHYPLRQLPQSSSRIA